MAMVVAVVAIVAATVVDVVATVAMASVAPAATVAAADKLPIQKKTTGLPFQGSPVVFFTDNRWI